MTEAGLWKIYDGRMQGSRQQRAAGIITQLDEETGADLVLAAKRTAQQCAQLAIEMRGLGMVTSFDRACPEGGFGSKRARQVQPIDIIPGQVLHATRV